MKTLVNLFLKYRKNMVLNFCLALLFLCFGLMGLFLTVDLTEEAIIVLQLNVVPFITSIVCFVIGLIKFTRIVDSYREKKIHESFENKKSFEAISTN